jgi:hypothetical protein
MLERVSTASNLGIMSKDTIKSVKKKYELNRLAFYSPDNLMKYNDPKRYPYKIIDIGILTASHLDRIDGFLKNVTEIELLIPEFDTLSGGDIRLRRDDSQFNISTDLVYSSLSGRFGVDRNKNYHNCTTFIEHVFPNIRCSTLKKAYIVNPKDCKNTPAMMTEELLATILQAMHEPTSTKFLALMKTIHPPTMFSFLKKT